MSCEKLFSINLKHLKVDSMLTWYVTARKAANCIGSAKTSVGIKPKTPKERQPLYFGTKNFEQFRFQ